MDKLHYRGKVRRLDFGLNFLFKALQMPWHILRKKMNPILTAVSSPLSFPNFSTFSCNPPATSTTEATRGPRVHLIHHLGLIPLLHKRERMRWKSKES